jgi:hypothetical protein
MKGYIFSEKNTIVTNFAAYSIPGVLSRPGGKAEIIPVEPEQGNACEGKV